MRATAVGMVGTASNTQRSVMLRADTAPFVFAVVVATVLSGLRAAARVMQGVHITEIAAVTGETGEVTTDIRTMDIPGIAWAIMAWAMAIRITGITVTALVGRMVHITDTTLGDTILTATNTGRT
jgi:hypothetical protein